MWWSPLTFLKSLGLNRLALVGFHSFDWNSLVLLWLHRLFASLYFGNPLLELLLLFLSGRLESRIALSSRIWSILRCRFWRSCWWILLAPLTGGWDRADQGLLILLYRALGALLWFLFNSSLNQSLWEVPLILYSSTITNNRLSIQSFHFFLNETRSPFGVGRSQERRLAALYCALWLFYSRRCWACCPCLSVVRD